jgi:hypothetical protein
LKNVMERDEMIIRTGPVGGPRPRRADPSCVTELIDALSPHPGGLRRWSVMRAIRRAREAAHRDVPAKFEDEIERVFRKFCTDGDFVKAPDAVAKDALFFRPRDKAGEVWALIPERANAWLAGEIVRLD